MKQEILNEKIDSAVEFWRWTDTIDGRCWLYSSTRWQHTGNIKEKPQRSIVGVLITYIEKTLLCSRVENEIIANSFFHVYNSAEKKREFIAFLEMVYRMRESQN